jgi:hypothetical protein
MSDNNGWPGKPGVPLNPEREGWHWLSAKLGDPEPYYWTGGLWMGSDQFHIVSFSETVLYLGPALTPAEVDARVVDALKWRDAINDALTNWLLPIEDHETPKDALQRLIRLEVMAALDPAVSRPAADLVAQARRDALEEAARRLEELHENHKYNPKTGEGSEHDAGYYRALAEGAAAIRALKGEAND